MAAYRRVDDLTVTCRLTACTPGSAPGQTLGIEYGKPLPFLPTVQRYTRGRLNEIGKRMHLLSDLMKQKYVEPECQIT